MNEDDLISYADRLSKAKGSADKAVEIYLHFLERDPINVKLLMKTASALYFCDDWGKLTENGYEKQLLAIQLAEKAVELDPDNAETHSVLASVLIFWGENDQTYLQRAAKEHWQALELDPKHIWASISVARARKYHNITLDWAIDILERTWKSHYDEEEPELVTLLSELASLYKEKGDLRKALSIYESALSKVPPNEGYDPYRRGLPRTISNLRKKIKKQQREMKA